MSVHYFPAVIDRSASGFGVSFPDLPGCIAAGDTVQQAAINAEAALALHLDAMRADGDAIPEPSSLDEIEPVDGADDVALILVRASVEAKFMRVQITLEESLLSAIDAATPNRSAFLAEAARAALRQKQQPSGYIFERFELAIKNHLSTHLKEDGEPADSAYVADRFRRAMDKYVIAQLNEAGVIEDMAG